SWMRRITASAWDPSGSTRSLTTARRGASWLRGRETRSKPKRFSPKRGTGNRIEANRIFDNEGLGIDLGPGTCSNGVTLNDADDTDTGANGLQNFPNLVTASSCGSTTKIQTGFGSRPSSSYQLEYFYNDSCDSTGWGEGK